MSFKQLLKVSGVGAFFSTFYVAYSTSCGPHYINKENGQPNFVQASFNMSSRIHSFWISRLAAVFVQSLFAFQDVSINGNGHLKADGPMILAANHNSFVDGWMVRQTDEFYSVVNFLCLAYVFSKWGPTQLVLTMV